MIPSKQQCFLLFTSVLFFVAGFYIKPAMPVYQLSQESNAAVE